MYKMVGPKELINDTHFGTLVNGYDSPKGISPCFLSQYLTAFLFGTFFISIFYCFILSKILILFQIIVLRFFILYMFVIIAQYSTKNVMTITTKYHSVT